MGGVWRPGSRVKVRCHARSVWRLCDSRRYRSAGGPGTILSSMIKRLLLSRTRGAIAVATRISRSRGHLFAQPGKPETLLHMEEARHLIGGTKKHLLSSRLDGALRREGSSAGLPVL